MAKMMGKIHSPQCDCDCGFVSGKGHKCNKVHGSKRQRTREKREWKKGIRNDSY